MEFLKAKAAHKLIDNITHYTKKIIALENAIDDIQSFINRNSDSSINEIRTDFEVLFGKYCHRLSIDTFDILPILQLIKKYYIDKNQNKIQEINNL